MKNILLIIFIYSFAYAQSPVERFNTLKNEILTLHATGLAATIDSSIQFKRDAGIFSFHAGTLYLLTPINDAVHALLFIGDGEFSCLLPTDIEKNQLMRYYKKDVFSEHIRSIFFLFNDSTYTEFSRAFSFHSQEINRKVSEHIKLSVKYILNDYRTGIETEIIRPFLFNEPGDFFYSHIVTDDDVSYFFLIDPYEREEIRLQQQPSQTTVIASGIGRETVCQFDKEQDYLRGINLSHKNKSSMIISSYNMDNYIATDLKLSSRCSVSMNIIVPGRRWIPFYLFNKLQIDSVLLDNKKIYAVQEEKSNIVWIGSDSVYSVHKDFMMTFFYHGDIISHVNGWFSLKTSIGWYPWQVDDKQYSTFDLTFHTPSKYKFASIGKKISDSSESSDYAISHWILNKRGRNASFFIGSYDSYEVHPDSLPTITVYTSTSHDAQLKYILAQNMVPSGSHMDRQIAGDITNSMKFFEKIYGEKHLDHFYAAEVPDYHGEAFPGLIHLSWATFQNTNSNGSDEVFRAHEVAHQWWGADGVDFRTYHDQWLSEAFAEYSGMWYMQLVLKDNEKFFAMLEQYKKSIMSNRKYLFGSGQEAGPISLGMRTQSTRTEGDYNLIIYRKGAWVLHMLRNMVIDLKTMNEDVFTKTMKDFYSIYAGSLASTEDFQEVVEHNFGMDMSWFFKQWVYGTDIPTYNVLYKRIELPDGKFKVHCTVKQINVPDDFQMYVPFFIDFGENRFARVRYLIKGPITEIDFPILPLKPKEIKFNDLESVLCEIDDEGWE